jgi:hypothetical protein
MNEGNRNFKMITYVCPLKTWSQSYDFWIYVVVGWRVLLIVF